MSIAELHPEDLLDRAARGVLTGDERARLDEHLRGCAACRLELEMRAEFAMELQAAERAAHAKLLEGALALSGVMHQAREVAPDAPPRVDALKKSDTPAPRVKRRAAPKRLTLILVAAALSFAGGALARFPAGRIFANLTGQAAESGALGTPAVPAMASKSAALAPSGHSPAPSLAASADAPTAPVDTASTANVAPLLAPSSSALVPSSALSGRPDRPSTLPPPQQLPTSQSVAGSTAGIHAEATKGHLAASAPLVSAPELVPPAPAEPSAAASTSAFPTTAAQLFDEASRARRAGEHAKARALYTQLLEQHAASAEANTARVALARVELDAGHGARALALFEQYLASGERALREEAMVGRARALLALGRVQEEREAWRTLLSTFPATLHRERAEARIATIDAR
jgi:tetratricopeptide (TPR) repeat protein